MHTPGISWARTRQSVVTLCVAHSAQQQNFINNWVAMDVGSVHHSKYDTQDYVLHINVVIGFEWLQPTIWMFRTSQEL